MFDKSYLNKGGSSIKIVLVWTPASNVNAFNKCVVKNGILRTVLCIVRRRCGHVVPWQRVWSIDKKAFFYAL